MKHDKNIFLWNSLAVLLRGPQHLVVKTGYTLEWKQERDNNIGHTWDGHRKKKDDVVPVYSQSNGQIIWLVEFFCLLSFQNNFIKAFTFVFFISFSIYPSQEHDCNNSPTLVLSVNSNNTGSLPDLSVLQFPSPLATPLDQEDPYNNVNAGTPVSLSPTSPHHMPIGHQSSQSPSQRRRQTSGIPSPLVLNQIGGPSSPVSSRWTCLY